MGSPYLPLTDEDRRAMLQALGFQSIDELFARIIPEEARFQGTLDLPPALSELEVRKVVESLARQNRADLTLFIGGGVYDHYIPAAVKHIVSRSEFYTAYTPYQAEVSQGTLQAMYEFQSAICDLTGMEVANSSMYDGASALAEAALMALRIQKKRNRILYSEDLNPRYRQVLHTYTRRQDLEIVEVPTDPRTGQMDLNFVEDALDDRTAALLFQHPNYFGILEEPFRLRELTERVGALLVVAFDPISLGILEPPGAYGADIAVGEGQPLGLPLGFGGPYLGLFAAREKYLRQMPGRIAGATVDAEGKRGYVMALQTREQHIRREKATSNICTNQMLCALTALVYLSLMGKEGLREVAEQSAQKAHYLADQLTRIPGVRLAFEGPFFREFVLELEGKTAREVRDALLADGILFGHPVAKHRLLVAVTEKRTRQEMDRVVQRLREVMA